MPFEWTQEYSVGVTKLDDQHKELFRLINLLEDAVNSGHGRQAVKEILRSLGINSPLPGTLLPSKPKFYF